MAYAMGRTPAKSQQGPEMHTEVDRGTDPLTAKNTRYTMDVGTKPELMKDLPGVLDLAATEAPPLGEIEELVDVRRLTGEWEKGLKPVSKTISPPLKSNARPKQTSPKVIGNTFAKMTSVTAKIKTKEVHQQPFEPRTSSTRRPSVEVSISPGTTGAKYKSRLTEAKAMMSKVRNQLNSSRNTSGVIKKEVMDAAERLLHLVGEAEADRKMDQAKDDTNGAIKNNSRGELGEKRDSNIRDTVERDDRIIAKIEDNNKLLKENEKRMQEIRQMLEEQRESVEKITYASIAREGKRPETKNRIDKNKTLHSIVVTSQDDQETGEHVLEKIRKAVEAKEGWIKVEKVRKAKDRKIIMGCSTLEDREKIREKLEKAGQHLVIEDMKNKDPLMVLKDVLIMHSDEEIVRALRNQNREVFHGLNDEENRITVKYRKRTKNPHTGHIVVTVSPTIWGRATEKGRMRIDLQNVFVEDQSPLVQCSKCLGYGHSRRFCKAPADLCSHCGGPHLSVDCPDKVIGEPPKCVNCKRSGYEVMSHNAFSRECPVRRKRDSIARASIQYC